MACRAIRQICAGTTACSTAICRAPTIGASSGPTGPVSVRVTGTLKANNGDVLETAMLAGLGVSLQPTFIAARDLQAGRLVAVMPDYVDESASVYAVYPHSRHLSAKVRAFIDFLARALLPRAALGQGFRLSPRLARDRNCQRSKSGPRFTHGGESDIANSRHT